MHLWALRAIENSQMVLNDNDLIDFINIAKNKTWGYLRIHLDNPEDGANIDNSVQIQKSIVCLSIEGEMLRKVKEIRMFYNGILFQNLPDKSKPFILGISMSMSIRW